MKKVVIFSILIITICTGLTALQRNQVSTPVDKQESYTHGSVEYSFRTKMDTIDDVICYSDNIVKATLLSYEDFNGSVQVYHFEVDKDYTDNTEKEINMYDAYNDQYQVGHTYYLFLSAGESPLYPHTIYTSIDKELIVDADSTVDTVENSVKLLAKDADNIISDAIGTNFKSAKVNIQESRLFDGTEVADVANTADVILELRVSDEQPENRYASTYKVEYVATKKGSEINLADYMLLPPGLDDNENYYVFLQEDLLNPGTYNLYATELPVVKATLKNEEKLELD